MSSGSLARPPAARSLATCPALLWAVPAKYTIVPYQSTHNTGGTIMGTNPGNSAVNKYLQSWDCHNLFVVGANVFPHNAAYQPTGLVGALSYWTADAIKNRYLKNQTQLVSA